MTTNILVMAYGNCGSDYGPGYRVYFAKEENRIILLLIGGDKGTQSRDITQAEGYLQDHKGRC